MVRNRSKWVFWVAMIWALCCLPGATVLAQRSTEMYIPIGKSPGVSGTSTRIGMIESVDAENETFVLRDGDTQLTIRCDARTRIWLDRSKAKLTNQVGKPSDCRPPRRVEVKFVADAASGIADWVKVEAGGE